ncbi:MAG: YwaF family protein [Clostridia bacterium]|nr:YwaF family protein [Clostridia bacterium]
MIKEFFGIGGYTRTPEGAYSWQHLTFVGLLLALMVVLAVWLGCRNRRWNVRTQNRVMIWAAILIDGLELIKIALSCYTKQVAGEPWYEGILYNLPLFLCSIQLIVIPLAAFTKGRLREISADFVALFGLLGAVLGTVGAAQNYNAYPVLGFDNVVSGLTHTISGFASLYVMIAGLATFKRSNVPGCVGLLLGFCGAAFAVNTWVIPRNYMFLTGHDGTPYQIVYDLVGGSPLWYPLSVVGLFVVYMAAFYAVARLLRIKKRVTVNT